MNKQLLDQAVAIVLDTDPAQFDFPSNMATIALEAHTTGLDTPLYAKHSKAVRSHFQNAFAKASIEVDDELIELALENYLECVNINQSQAAALSKRIPLAQAGTTFGEAGKDFALENFDNSYDVSLAVINAAFNIYRSYGKLLSSQSDKIFPIVNIGSKTGYSVPIDRPFAHYKSFHTDGTPQDYDEVGILNLLDSPHEPGSLRIYPDATLCEQSLLADPAKIADYEVMTMDHDTHMTRPYKFGKLIDLKGASLTAEDFSALIDAVK